MNKTTDRERAVERALARRDALALIITGPLVAVLLLVAWTATGGGYFWPAWPMLGMSIAILVALWRALGPAGHTGAADVRPRPRPR